MIKFKDSTLDELNKNYRKKKFLNTKILDVFFGIFMFLALCYFLFCFVFIQAQVVGFSMQPTLNSSLRADENPITSIYKDVVYANRFDKGTNGDIILIETKEEIIIKRLIATEGQKLTLKLNETDGYFYYFVDGKMINEDYIGEFRTNMDINYFNKFRTVVGVDIIIPDEEAEIILPLGKFFALGDNRAKSQDSTAYGAFEASKILGCVKFYYSYNQTFLGFIWERICSVF